MIQRFGDTIVARDRTIDRGASGGSSLRIRRRGRISRRSSTRSCTRPSNAGLPALPAGTPAGVADIPLLFETGREADFDLVVVAACSPDEQVRRLVARDGLAKADALARIATQRPIAEKVARAGVVIDTNGSIEDTNRQVDALLATWSV